jgi:predicted MFS family arabinose efflux permease
MLPYCILIVAFAFLPVIFCRDLRTARLAVYVGLGIYTIGVTGITASYTAMIMNLVSPENRAGHYTFKLIEMYLAWSLSAVMFGYLCDRLGYRPVFIMASLVTVALYLFST